MRFRGPRYLEEIDADELGFGPPRRPVGAPGHAQGATVAIDLGEQRRVVQGFGWDGGPSTLVLTRQDDPTDAQVAAAAVDMDAPIFARVMIGWPGVVEYVEADWISGTMLYLPTPNISVDAVFPIDTVGDPIGGWRTRVGAFVQPGARPAGGAVPYARRSHRCEILTPLATSARVAVPPRAHAVSLLLRQPTGPAGYGAVAVDFLRAAADSTKAPRVLYRQVPADDAPMLLETGIRSLEVENLSGTTNTRPTLIFALAM